MENLEELIGVAGRVRRQPRARGRVGADRRSRSSCSRSRSTPTRTTSRDEREPGHPDDAPQRQGPRVRGGLHDRLRGGRLPALRSLEEGERGGGAPPLLRRHHPRPPAPLPHPRAQPARSSAAAASAASPRASSTSCPDELVERQGTRRRRPIDRLGDRGARGRRRRPEPSRAGARASRPATTSSTPASARAWSPAVEPGGVIVVRFAGDGAERKLMADYAPMKKAHERGPRERQVIDGKAVAAEVRERVARRGRRAVAESGRPPRAWRPCWSATTPPPTIYVRNKRKACEEAGIALDPPRAWRRDRPGGAARAGRAS